MTKLNCDKMVIIKTDYSDIEELINRVYGYDYEIMPMEEVGSSQYNATYDIDVSMGELSEFEKKDLYKLSNGNPPQYILSTIMTDLCNRGYLDAGEYIISVSW